MEKVDELKDFHLWRSFANKQKILKFFQIVDKSKKFSTLVLIAMWAEVDWMHWNM